MYGQFTEKFASAVFLVSTALLVNATPAIAQENDGGQPVEGGAIEAEINSSDLGHILLPAVSDNLQWIAAKTENYWLGVQAAPIDDVLRAQLAVEAGQGLVVTEVVPESPAEEAGLQAHDVLLMIAGRPLADGAALEKQVNAAGNTATTIAFLRGGKQFKIDVTPRNRNWRLTEVSLRLDIYRIGVGVAAADETLRSQLGLPDNVGQVVTNVDAESPAASAGIELHDVLLQFGGKPLTTLEGLTSQIQEVGEKPATMKLLRGGKTTSLEVTPAKNQSMGKYIRFVDVVGDLSPVDVTGSLVIAGEALMEVDLHDTIQLDVNTAQETSVETEKEDTDAPLRELIEQIKQLNRRIEALEQSVRESQSSD